MTIAVITENTSAQNATPDDLYTGLEDTRLRQGNSTTNYETSTSLEMTKYGSGDHTHSVFQFSGLSNLPGSVTVNSAYLYVRMWYGTSTSQDMDIRRILQSNTITSMTWATYNGSSNWNTAGCLGAGTDRVSTPIDTIAISGGGWYAFDITSYIQDVLDGTYSDNGVHTERNGAGEDATYKVFYSSEGTNAFRPELVIDYTTGGPTYTLTADSASYAYTGNTATLTASRLLSAESSSHTYTASNAGLYRGYLLSPESGSYTYTASNVDLIVSRFLDAGSASYTYTGTDVTLTYTPLGSTYTLSADSASYVYAGTSINLTVSRLLSAESTAYTYTATDATLARSFLLNAESGSYVYTASNVDFARSYVLSAESGSFVYSASDISLTYSGQAFWSIQSDSTTTWGPVTDSSDTWAPQSNNTTTWI